jgi:hypothetical protein
VKKTILRLDLQLRRRDDYGLDRAIQEGIWAIAAEAVKKGIAVDGGIVTIGLEVSVTEREG